MKISDRLAEIQWKQREIQIKLTLLDHQSKTVEEYTKYKQDNHAEHLAMRNANLSTQSLYHGNKAAQMAFLQGFNL